MLVLSRHQGEDIVLRHTVTGEEIVILLTSQGTTVSRIGIEADRENWTILRGEIDTGRETRDEGQGQNDCRSGSPLVPVRIARSNRTGTLPP
jgi:sRNA-binding carbon storage regulator CsrA